MILPAIPLVLLDLIGSAVRQAAANPAIPIAPADADEAAAGIAAEAERDPRFREVADALAHAANGEPWYRSRVTWGALVAGAASVASVFGLTLAPADLDLVVGLLTAGGALAGSALTLYGRWHARRPIGTPGRT